MGATGDVWNGWSDLLDVRWPGRWLAPDLPGHGGSDPLPRYSFGAVAASVAKLVKLDERAVVLGHFMGGVVGLALASGWFGVQVETVVGLGIKVAWTDDEPVRVGGLARRPVAWFDTYDEAASRYLRVSGLGGGSPKTRSRSPSVRLTCAACWLPRANVTLARGEHDRMVSDEQLRELVPTAVTLSDLRHNAHVEHPAAVLRLLEPTLR